MLLNIWKKYSNGGKWSIIRDNNCLRPELGDQVIKLCYIYSFNKFGFTIYKFKWWGSNSYDTKWVPRNGYNWRNFNWNTKQFISHVSWILFHCNASKSDKSFKTLREIFTYRTRAIITRGLYIFYPIFHCSLYCRAVSVTDNLCTKQGNSSIFGSKICGL